MQTLTQYVMPPSCCYYCRGTKTPCLDLQRDDEDNPNKIEHIYLCADCLFHGVRLVGPAHGYELLPVTAVAGLEGEIRALRAQLDEAYGQRDLAVAARDALVSSYGAAPAAVPSVATIQPSPPEPKRRTGSKPPPQAASRVASA